MKYLLLSFMFLFQSVAVAADDPLGHFSGRISKINDKASLMRVNVKFANMKYLNKQDRLEFWNEHNPLIRCRATIVGKSPDYVLLQINDFDFCLKKLFIAHGGYMKFYSQDLANNLKMGSEILSILLKKRLAVSGRLGESKKQLESHLDKVDSINKRYELLRQKLELEWQQELALLEEDRIVSLRNHKALELRLSEIEQKIEQYKVEDENLEIDRWALDPTLYFKK